MGTITSLTFEDFEKLPDSPGKRELLDGELIEMPPPKTKHTKIQERIFRALDLYVLDNNLGDVHMEAGYKLGNRHWVQPDVSLASVEQDRASDPEGYLEGAPRLAVKVISQANTAESIDRKIAKYFEYGGEEVWVFYPKTRRVWLYRRNNSLAVEHNDELTSALFPGWVLNLAKVFA
jgi:Uma2 family endonuclease